MSSTFCSGRPQLHTQTDVFSELQLNLFVLEQGTGRTNKLAEAHDLCNDSRPWDFDNVHLHEELCG